MKISWLEPNLAASGIPVTEQDLISLQEQGVRAILTLTERPLSEQTRISPALLEQFGVVNFHAPIVDQYPPDETTMRQAVAFIEQMQAESRPVLVHCHAGVGRTGTILHAYYLLKGLSLESAKTKVKANRPHSQFLMLSDTQKAFLEQVARTNP